MNPQISLPEETREEVEETTDTAACKDRQLLLLSSFLSGRMCQCQHFSHVAPRPVEEADDMPVRGPGCLSLSCLGGCRCVLPLGHSQPRVCAQDHPEAVAPLFGPLVLEASSAPTGRRITWREKLHRHFP